jgi:hypothetical protein
MYVNDIKASLSGVSELFFSTWRGSENAYTDSDEVFFNELPPTPGPANICLQQTTTLNGLVELKKRNYTHVLKVRSDMILTNPRVFFDNIKNDSLNFLCWHHHEVYPNCPGYFVDFLMSGPIDNMIELWSFNDYSWCTVPEIFLTWNYINKLSLINDVEYFLNTLDTDNDVLWIKNNYMLSTYKQDRKDLFKKYTYSHSKEFLTKEYRNFLIK